MGTVTGDRPAARGDQPPGGLGPEGTGRDLGGDGDAPPPGTPAPWSGQCGGLGARGAERSPPGQPRRQQPRPAPPWGLSPRGGPSPALCPPGLPGARPCPVASLRGDARAVSRGQGRPGLLGPVRRNAGASQHRPFSGGAGRLQRLHGRPGPRGGEAPGPRGAPAAAPRPQLPARPRFRRGDRKRPCAQARCGSGSAPEAGRAASGGGLALRRRVRGPEAEASAGFRAADSRACLSPQAASLRGGGAGGHAVRGALLGDPAGAAQFRQRSPLLPPRLAAAGRGCFRRMCVYSQAVFLRWMGGRSCPTPHTREAISLGDFSILGIRFRPRPTFICSHISRQKRCLLTSIPRNISNARWDQGQT